ncbi:unnamed protein product [Lampetra planeri]
MVAGRRGCRKEIWEGKRYEGRTGQQDSKTTQERLLGREMREPLPLAGPPRPDARPVPHPSSFEPEAAPASELKLWQDQGEPNPAAEPGETKAPRGTRPQCWDSTKTIVTP